MNAYPFRSLSFFLLLTIGTPLILLLCLSLGDEWVSIGNWYKLLLGNGDTLQREIILKLRLPRLLNALGVGALLALSGTLMQVLLRNPLADPYVLGVSGGATIGSLMAFLLGFSGLWFHLSTTIGAIVSISILFLLASQSAVYSTERLLLTGIVLAAGWSALTSFVLVLAPAAYTKGMLYWLMGDLSYGTSGVYVILIAMAALILCLPYLKVLNLLVSGDLTASALGVSVKSIRVQLYFFTSILTAIAVIIAGPIGFIGLVVPHMTRLIVGGNHQYLVPTAMWFGALYLGLADSIARSLLSPQQLPSGVITALLGIPIFLLLLIRSQK
ncbi:MAG TPA: ABC transporter permease [Gammaproteobacteria bacterium]|nr:ABC transporter permease [Gammaproteobacteria bacterium]